MDHHGVVDWAGYLAQLIGSVRVGQRLGENKRAPGVVTAKPVRAWQELMDAGWIVASEVEGFGCCVTTPTPTGALVLVHLKPHVPTLLLVCGYRVDPEGVPYELRRADRTHQGRPSWYPQEDQPRTSWLRPGVRRPRRGDPCQQPARGCRARTHRRLHPSSRGPSSRYRLMPALPHGAARGRWPARNESPTPLGFDGLAATWSGQFGRASVFEWDRAFAIGSSPRPCARQRSGHGPADDAELAVLTEQAARPLAMNSPWMDE